MDNLNPVSNPPAPIPPVLPPLGESPEEREAIRSPVGAVEALLRQPRRVVYQLKQDGSARLGFWLFILAAVCSLLYGAVVGSFSMGNQLWAAAIKTAMGFCITTLICLPSLYIFACLSGAKVKPGEVFGLAAGLLLLTTVLLIGFAPVAWLFSQSTTSAVWMGVLHFLFLFIAVFFGARFLKFGFRYSEARSTAGLFAWTFIFLLVALQMTTTLRPLVGTSETFLRREKKFFLAHWGDQLDAALRPNPRTSEPARD